MPRVSQLPTAASIGTLYVIEGGVSKRMDYPLAAGLYVPALTTVANCSSAAAGAFMWQRSGNIISVCGQLAIDPIAAGVATRVGISLPVPSAMVAGDNASGVAVMNAVTGACGALFADPANDRLELSFVIADIINRQWYVTAMYRVI